MIAGQGDAHDLGLGELAVADHGALCDLAEVASERFRTLRVSAAFLARDVDTGVEVGVDVGRPMPLASVAKVPLALVVADRIARGEIDGGAMVRLAADARSYGPYGISAFTHDATCSVADLMLMMLGLSDNAAADALFDKVSPREVDEQLAEWGVEGLRVRHRMQPMYDYATRVAGPDFALATQLAVEGRRPGGRHVIDSLDVERAAHDLQPAVTTRCEVSAQRLARGDRCEKQACILMDRQGPRRAVRRSDELPTADARRAGR